MILMNDFKKEPKELCEAMKEVAQRVMDSGWYVLGNELIEFEKQWASVCGVSSAIGVGNGMDAIEISLRALDIGQGDEVITSPMTAFATALAIIRSGATPVLADIDHETALLSLDSVVRCLTSKTKAIVLVHLYGQVSNMDDWVSFCKNRNLFLIEDCAQAHLAEWGGKVAGSFGVAGAYSFYPTKNLGALGDAGIIVTDDNRLAQRAGDIRNYGQSVRYHHPELGLNSRMDEMQAGILSVRLKWLTIFTEQRRKIANEYRERINNNLVQLLAPPEDALSHVYHLFVIICEERDALMHFLFEKNVHSLIHYPIPVHKQKSCQNIISDPIGLKNSEVHAATCLSLPCHPQMTNEDVDGVISAVNSFQGK